MTLELIEGSAGVGADAYSSATFDLRLQPTRPGLAHEALALELDARLADAVAVAANADGAPSELWAAVAIESEHRKSSKRQSPWAANRPLAKALALPLSVERLSTSDAQDALVEATALHQLSSPAFAAPYLEVTGVEDPRFAINLRLAPAARCQDPRSNAHPA
jgi:hypothetical protein